MLAIGFSQEGHPIDVLTLQHLESQPLQAGCLRAEVLASPINPADLMQIRGLYGIPAKCPAIGGMEGVGRVVEVAGDVSGFKLGQLVLLPPGSGTWRQELVAPASTFTVLPDDCDLLQFSMLTVNPPTAYLILKQFVELKKGDCLVQNAANSAVGGYMIQFAKMYGVKTINIVRRAEVAQQILDKGGDLVLIDGPHLDKELSAAAKDFSIKLAVDAVGGDITVSMAKVLQPGGILVNYGALSGKPCCVSPRDLIFRDIGLKGFWLSHWFSKETLEGRQALYRELSQLLKDGQLKAAVDQTYPLTEFKQAIHSAADGVRNGKVVFTPQEQLP